MLDIYIELVVKGQRKEEAKAVPRAAAAYGRQLKKEKEVNFPESDVFWKKYDDYLISIPVHITTQEKMFHSN